MKIKAPKTSKTCLNANCPERKGGTCTAGETSNEQLREEFEKHFEEQGYGGEYSGMIDAPFKFVADWWIAKLEEATQDAVEELVKEIEGMKTEKFEFMENLNSADHYGYNFALDAVITKIKNKK